MLLDIRDTVRNSKPIKYTLITLISIPFALVGIGSYFAGGSQAEVAEVGGIAISQPEVDQAYNRLKGQYSQMFGGNIPENLMPDAAIRQQALDGLVTDIVVRNEVADQKFAIGDETLGKAIRKNPNFQVDGKFSKEAYQDQIRGSLSNTASYEEALRSRAAISQFRAGIAATSFQLPSETKFIESLSGQTRTIDFVRYSIDTAVATIDVSDEQVSAHFEENADSYKFPERSKIEYIELNKVDLAAAIDVSDEEAQEHYDEFNANYINTPEVRETSHILLEVDTDDSSAVAAKTEELNALKARVVAGESFADLAKEFSDDIGSAQAGGSLGQLEPSFLAKQYVDAAAALKADGDLSGVVKTQFGLHLIKLDKFAAAVVTPFEEVKADIVSLLQNNAADSDFLELQTAMEEAVSSDPESLAVAADEANVEVMQSDWIDIDTQGELIFSNPQVLTAAFSEELLTNQNNSDVIQIAPGHVVAIRNLEYEEPRPKALEDVKESILAQLKRDGAAEQLDASAADAVAKILKGTPVATVAEGDATATATNDEVLDRTSFVIDASAVAEIFALPKPAPGKTLVKSVALQNGDRVAYALKAVITPEPEVAEASAEVEGEATVTVNPSLGQSELAALIASLREKADISISE